MQTIDAAAMPMARKMRMLDAVNEVNVPVEAVGVVPPSTSSAAPINSLPVSVVHPAIIT